jgi:hypothetical protein
MKELFSNSNQWSEDKSPDQDIEDYEENLDAQHEEAEQSRLKQKEEELLNEHERDEQERLTDLRIKHQAEDHEETIEMNKRF